MLSLKHALHSVYLGKQPHNLTHVPDPPYRISSGLLIK